MKLKIILPNSSSDQSFSISVGQWRSLLHSVTFNESFTLKDPTFELQIGNKRKRGGRWITRRRYLPLGARDWYIPAWWICIYQACEYDWWMCMSLASPEFFLRQEKQEIHQQEKIVGSPPLRVGKSQYPMNLENDFWQIAIKKKTESIHHQRLKTWQICEKHSVNQSINQSWVCCKTGQRRWPTKMSRSVSVVVVILDI